jgi:cobalt-zinc-cadmium efflux system protein
MESSPAHIDPEAVERDLLALEGVSAVHDLHIWSVSSGTAALSVHLKSASPRDLLARARAMLRDKHGIHHTTLQIESPETSGSEPCEGC